ncbi:pyridoxal-5'-phosphate-dependent protein [Corynebacterium sp. HMSC061H03]|uniref:DegT/DnrJ/EryC1/StrS family aminotransferase n=1 Tax=unclassified Corynebacterium TaxID=2624378 RepID=UPI0008A63FB3|nr:MULTISPECIES: DegT/DnrJ/EryC1/StrS aminotransferase family protein [unclassified Corynebacterium]ASE57071.1 DegT/DnrJ/EryC1/StrS aminotransferase family protein [Corynebacterium jeikeium]MDU4703362.1 DegT/DnrJ/EryC1/StrS aminotransferase family protein [Corynebacterium sp.]MBC6807205.1 DegT/DnrJ/EryC1/StrS aminotransferase family protein [Corynebacterium sp. LK30]OFL72907.1 pyridoxal-5'-phosphate-dependent protein [Corynebacterium sp. HMSC063G05]OHR23893.1 pyridoxal-5'-phosphate-dependent p
MTNADANKPNERIFLSLATVTEAEEQAVVRALHSGWVAPLGPEVDAFEAEIAKRCGVELALALSSGTAGLHLALLALGIGEGDYIPVSTMTFAATTNAIAYVGATPVFVDAAEDGNIDPELLLRTVDELLAEGKSVPAVMIVDLFGRCADYPAFAPRLEELGIALIEDAAEALGASVHGQPAGSFGRAAALSFNGNKIMTTSGGGMLLSNDADLIARARYLSTQARQPVAWYEHTEIGYNYRLSSLLAALGRAQHSRLDDMIARRRQIRDAYIDLLASLDDDAPGKGTRLLSDSDERFTENCWLTSIVLPQEAVDKGVLSPDSVVAALGEANIEARHLWKPMHLQPVYEGARATINGTAENLFSRGITLPSGPALDDDDVARVIGVLKEVLG